MKNLDIRYFVDENAKVVVCVIYAHQADVFREFEDILRKVEHLPLWGTHSMFNPTKFVGKAKCHPEDVFDAEKGKELARARALKKYNMAKLDAYIALHKPLLELVERLENTIAFYNYRAIECEADEYTFVEGEE